MIENLVVNQQAGYTSIRGSKTQALSNLSFRDGKLELAGVILPEKKKKKTQNPGKSCLLWRDTD